MSVKKKTKVDEFVPSTQPMDPDTQSLDGADDNMFNNDASVVDLTGTPPRPTTPVVSRTVSVPGAPLRVNRGNRVRSHKWCFTLNLKDAFKTHMTAQGACTSSCTDDDLIELAHRILNQWHYLIEQIETPVEEVTELLWLVARLERGDETNSWHYQGFFVLNKILSLSTLKKAGPVGHLAHFEAMKGSYTSNSEYCEKGSIWKNHRFGAVDYGSALADPVHPGEREQNRYEVAKNLALSGEYDKIDAQILVSNLSNLTKLRYVLAPKVRVLKPEELECVWLYGAPRTGKSYFVFSKYMNSEGYLTDLYQSTLTRWFDGYNGEQSILLDDVDEGLISRGLTKDLIKKLCDIYPLPVEVKGSMTQIRPRKVYVTSNFSIEAVFAAQTRGGYKCLADLAEHERFDLLAIKRRFMIYRFDDPTKLGTFRLEPNDVLNDISVPCEVPGQVNTVNLELQRFLSQAFNSRGS